MLPSLDNSLEFCALADNGRVFRSGFYGRMTRYVYIAVEEVQNARYLLESVSSQISSLRWAISWYCGMRHLVCTNVEHDDTWKLEHVLSWKCILVRSWFAAVLDTGRTQSPHTFLSENLARQEIYLPQDWSCLFHVNESSQIPWSPVTLYFLKPWID